MPKKMRVKSMALQEFDLDQYKCLRSCIVNVHNAIEQFIVLNISNPVLIKTARKITFKRTCFVVDCCSIHDPVAFYINNLKPTFKYHIKCKTSIDGIIITLKPPTNVLSLATWTIKNAYVITNAEAQIHSEKDISNPTTKPIFKVKLRAQFFNGTDERGKRRTIAAILKDGLFYRSDGELFNAVNNAEVATELINKI